SAFEDRINLKTVTIPNGVTKIGKNAFKNCANLTRISIPGSVTTIGVAAFFRCISLKTVTIPRGVTTIESSAFYSCKSLTRVSIPNTVTTIGNSAFILCNSLTRVTIPEGVTTLGYSAFYSCISLTRVSVPSTVRKIEKSTFLDCLDLTQVDMGNGVETIGEDAFARCRSLTDIVLPNSMQTIKKHAFRECTGLSSIVLPDSMGEIDADAFKGCPHLRVVAAPEGISEADVQSAAPDAALEIVRLPDDLLPPALFLQVGQTMALPKFKGAKVKWSVQGGENTVATVGRGNKLKGVQAGEAVLKLDVLAAVKGKALTLNGQPLKPEKTYDIPLKVFGKHEETVKKVSVSAKSILMHPKGYGYPAKAKIHLAFTPASLTGSAEWKGNCLFVSSNPNVAQVNQEGMIFAIKPGKATIFVYAPNLKSAKVSVTVMGLVTYIKLKDSDGNYLKQVTLSEGSVFAVTPEFNVDAAFTAIRWSSSNPAVAIMNGNGKIGAVSKGTAKITATALDGSGKKATITVRVTEPPEAP
ncbi:MAG: leucine-rich repeat protein, partial [Christensenellales bacterium]